MYLLLLGVDRSTPILALQRDERPEEVPVTGDSRWARLKAAVYSSYRQLYEKFDYAERLCGRLRKVDRLTIVHSPAERSEEAEKKVRVFLDLSYSKHSRWFVVDAVLAAFGGVLAPLPGPNVFFFYPAVRALAHFYARQGARRAQQVQWDFKAEPDIARLQPVDRESDTRKAIEALQERYLVDDLSKILPDPMKR